MWRSPALLVWSASLAGLVTPATRACKFSLIRDRVLPPAAESPCCGASGNPWAQPPSPGSGWPTSSREGGMQANITWDLASTGEVLSEKKWQLSSVSKSKLNPGLAACGDLPWAGETCAWRWDVGKGWTWVWNKPQSRTAASGGVPRSI